MPTWTQQDDTYTAKVGGYTLIVWKDHQSERFSWIATNSEGTIKAGESTELENAKEQAEWALSELE